MTADEASQRGCFVGQTVVLRRFGIIMESEGRIQRAPGVREDRPHNSPLPSRAVTLHDVAGDRHKSKQKSERARLLGLRTAQRKTGWSMELHLGSLRHLSKQDTWLTANISDL